MCVCVCVYIYVCMCVSKNCVIYMSWLHELASHKDLQPTIPSSQGWVSSVHFNFHLLLLLYFYMDL